MYYLTHRLIVYKDVKNISCEDMCTNDVKSTASCFQSFRKKLSCIHTLWVFVLWEFYSWMPSENTLV
jgi:hypothetical protein